MVQQFYLFKKRRKKLKINDFLYVLTPTLVSIEDKQKEVKLNVAKKSNTIPALSAEFANKIPKLLFVTALKRRILL